ncbi:MAG: DUF1549 domain-containing protein [Verrucomicrobiales bacterium]|nr:DUF1549 domain-containing protein [Verrucomicrobiales bacterium]
MRHFRPAIALFTISLTTQARAEIDFVHQVVPILKEHCSECHAGEEAEGGFSMNTRDLFLDDETAEPGKAHESYFIDLIYDPDPDYQMPPDDKPRVPENQIAVLEKWVNEGMKWEAGFTFGTPTYEPPFKPRRPELPETTDGRDHPVDRIIDHYLSSENLEQPLLIDDSTFIRRVSLDLTGLLPEADRVRRFLSDDSPTKRETLIDELLADDVPYTEHWLTFWNDLLRNDYAGTGFITGGRTQISEWLYQSLKDNKPFDAMVRELIAPADTASSGFINGIEWRGTVSAGQTLPIQFSQSLSQSFLGINMKCASCHDSFLDRWTLDDAYGLAAIYSEEPIELHRCDKPTGEAAKAAWLFPEIGNIDAAAPKDKRLKQLANLMTHPENGRVPRTIVNRLWGQLMGRGIVHPLDAMQTEPWNEDLLDWLASDFQENGYDLKHALRRITTSAAYQGATAPHQNSEEGESYTFDGPRPKRLTAEQYVDAIWQITGNAPASYDAPVARGVVDPALVEKLSFESSWVWGPSAKPGPPPHGEKILLKKEFSPGKKKVRSAGLIAAADNAYVLYLNGRKIMDGSRWSELDAAPIANAIKPSNRLLIVAENRGPKPNAAGAFCALRIEYEDGTDEIIMTDETWKVSQTVPAGSRPNNWKLDDLSWADAVAVNIAQWKEATDKRIGQTLARASAGSDRLVRASLLKADDLMRALGRPNRDQIVTSRPSELTTLEAVNLATSDDLVTDLQAGAKKLAGNLSTDALIDEVYLSTLSRFPTEAEKSFATEALGETPDEATITDLLWAVTMTPEFLIVR